MRGAGIVPPRETLERRLANSIGPRRFKFAIWWLRRIKRNRWLRRCRFVQWTLARMQPPPLEIVEVPVDALPITDLPPVPDPLDEATGGV